MATQDESPRVPLNLRREPLPTIDPEEVARWRAATERLFASLGGYATRLKEHERRRLYTPKRGWERHAPAVAELLERVTTDHGGRGRADVKAMEQLIAQVQAIDTFLAVSRALAGDALQRLNSDQARAFAGSYRFLKRRGLDEPHIASALAEVTAFMAHGRRRAKDGEDDGEIDGEDGAAGGAGT